MNTTSTTRTFENATVALKRSLACGAAVGALLLSGAAFAQDAENSGMETVYVTGYRASLEKSIDIKRSTAEMVDAITAEDIGKFPDSNLAESLQRLPGVAVDRDNGEGRQITVRGLGSNFTRVTLNGLQALSTAGQNTAGTQPNRDRQFDFNTFASELFSKLTVQKTASAATEDGSLGATVALSTPRPFDYGEKFVLNAQNAWYENGKPFNPRVSALVSETFFGEKLGVLLSAAYTIKNQFIDSYARSPGQSDFAYRGSAFAFSALQGFNGTTAANPFRGRNGFAAPAGTPCNGTTLNGVIPGNNITNATYCAALSGSDPAAYALVNSPQGWGIYDSNTSTSTTSTYAPGALGALTLIPALPSLTHQQLYQQRIGLTGSVQWQADDKTLFSLDALFSTAYQNSTNYQISPVGLNRNNTANSLNTLTSVPTGLTAANQTSTTWTTSLFPNWCTPQLGSATMADVVCYSGSATDDLSISSTGALQVHPLSNVPATPYKNLSPLAYYTNPAYGYANTGADAMAAAIAAIGRPATKLVDAKVQTATPYGAATYLKLDNVDYRSGADQSYYTTQFSQLSLNGTHSFSDRLKVEGTLGWSHSYNHQTGLLAEFNHMDQRGNAATGAGYFVWDNQGGGEMPSMNFGMDVADPANWNFVKGYSALRHYEYFTDNKYRTALLNVSYALTDEISLQLGANFRIFDFGTAQYARNMRDVSNPGLQEAGVTVGQMSQTVNWGKGLDAPAGTPTRFLVPNLNAFENTFGFNCNCINTFGDWRVTNKFLTFATGNAGNTYNVGEHSKAYYAQLDFQGFNILGNPLMGNAGMRFVTTEIKAAGHGFLGDTITASSSYNDFLPSINLAYSLTDDMLIRAAAAKVIARPSLTNMAPSVTAMSIPTGGIQNTMTMATGNPDLKPYRAKTVDIGWEWYFDKGAMLAVTGFVKWVSSNPQIVVSSGHVSDFFNADQVSFIQAYYNGLPSSTNNQAIVAFIGTPTAAVNVTEALNGPGGVLEGVEITYQQHLDFIPAVFGGDGLGVNANYTKIRSLQHYITNSIPATATTPAITTTADGPWSGASPDAWNLTVYYDGTGWEARVSSAFRSGYLNQTNGFPLATGGDTLGQGNSPLVNDFQYSKNTINVDFSASYDVTENLEFTLDVLNLTNQPDRRWAYVNTPQTTNYASTGRQVFGGFRLKF